MNQINTYLFLQEDIDGVDYGEDFAWSDRYEGKFHLDTNPFQNIKPEVYSVGDTVEVMEVARECGNFRDWSDGQNQIGKKIIIEKVLDDAIGVRYVTERSYYYPSYAVRKVVEFEPARPEVKVEEVIELNGKRYKLIEE